MRFFVGREPDNHVPVGNGRLLATLQQYDDAQTPVDRLCQLFYPTYDHVGPLLGEEGSSVLVRDPAEKVWYDPYNVVRTRPGQYGECVSIDRSRFVDGTGIYQVLSHKGTIFVRSTTWVRRGCDALVRRLDIGTLRPRDATVDVFPVIHVRHLVGADDGILFCRRGDVHLALTCRHAEAWHGGDLATGLIDGFTNRIPAPWLLDPRLRGQDLRVSFRTSRAVPAKRPDWAESDAGWSEPVYLVVGAGTSEGDALATLKATLALDDCGYAETLEEHRQWLGAGALLDSPDAEWDYLWRTSLSLLRTAVQADGAPIMVGFAEYQGRVWIRDGVWIAITLAHAGHLPEALAVMRRLVRLLRQRPDGLYYCVYNGRTGEPAEHTTELDTLGLVVAGIAACWRCSGDATIVAEFRDQLGQFADWIVAHVEADTGFLPACAGIWETFGPHLERDYEHMAWTAGVSAYALQALVAMTGEPPDGRYTATANRLLAAIVGLAPPDGPLPRSLETTHLDSAVLTFFSWLPLLDPHGPLADRTIAAIEDRLVDPMLGGVWRHEDLTTEWGDMRPWIGPTLWLAEAHLVRGDVERAWAYLDWVNQHRSFCGLVPELMFSHDIPRGLAMPSYSQSGLIMALLRHFDSATGQGHCPPQWPWLRITGVPDGAGGRQDLMAGDPTAAPELRPGDVIRKVD